MILDSFIVCDDIRAELGNKVSLMGLFVDQIVFLKGRDQPSTWPKALKLAFYLRFIREERDNILFQGSTFKYYCEKNGNSELLGGGVFKDTKVPIDRDKFAITIIHNPFMVLGPGKVSFSIEFFDANQRLAQEKIKLGDMLIREEDVN